MAGAAMQDGKIRCTYCGTELDEMLLATGPCAIPTVWQTRIGELSFEISVWNCFPRLVCFREGAGRRYFEIQVEPELEEELERLMIDSIYAQGGAINVSGTYGMSDDLAFFLTDALLRQKIRITDREGGAEPQP
ncbi:MAG: hypothetical protein QW334_02915 [Thermofilum sp.]